MRIRWRSVGKLAAALAVGVAALQLLPGLLTPPQAPPLAADVGLPQTPAPREPAVEIHAPRRTPGGKPRPRPSHGVAAATAVIGTTPRRHQPKRRNGRVELPDPPAAPTPYAPPPPPEPPPAPAPEPPPPPDDGSLEFAPH